MLFRSIFPGDPGKAAETIMSVVSIRRYSDSADAVTASEEHKTRPPQYCLVSKKGLTRHLFSGRRSAPKKQAPSETLHAKLAILWYSGSSVLCSSEAAAASAEQLYHCLMMKVTLSEFALLYCLIEPNSLFGLRPRMRHHTCCHCQVGRCLPL